MIRPAHQLSTPADSKWPRRVDESPRLCFDDTDISPEQLDRLESWLVDRLVARALAIMDAEDQTQKP